MLEFIISASNLEMAQSAPVDNIRVEIRVEEIALLPVASGENDDIVFRTMCDNSGQYCVRLNRYYDGAEFQTNLTLIERGATGKIEYMREEAIEPKGPDNTKIGQIYSKIYVVTNGQDPNQKTILFGAIDNESEMYSGGGASYQTLNLFETVQSENALTRQILGLPIYGYKMIRACFSENEMRLRRGACHDEYSFNAKLTLFGRVQNGRPVFSYQSHATDFPRGSSLDNDNSGTRLRKADIVKTINRKCSVQRSFIYDPTTKFYKANQELPDCSDYF